MSAAEQMRDLINAINLREDPFVVLCLETNHGTMLVEGAQVLDEGAILDRIRKTTQAVANKYHDVQYSLLAKATNKALDVFGGRDKTDPKVSAALDKILKVGRAAVNNRALIMVLVGMVGTLIGLSSNPASAQSAAAQINDTLLQGNPAAIGQNMARDGEGVSRGLSDLVRALQDFDARHDGALTRQQPTATPSAPAAAADPTAGAAARPAPSSSPRSPFQNPDGTVNMDRLNRAAGAYGITPTRR